MSDLVDEYGYPDTLRANAPDTKKRWGPQIHKDHTPRRNTDYNFPMGWGKKTPEQKSRWYLKQRVFKQASRQFDNGVFPDWISDRSGKSWPEAMYDADKNDFKKK